MLKLSLSDWIRWAVGHPNRSHNVTHTHTPAGHGDMLIDGTRGHSSASVSSHLSISVFRFASDKLLDMRKYHYGSEGLQQGWAAGGTTALRDNKKSRMGLLGAADIDG